MIPRFSPITAGNQAKDIDFPRVQSIVGGMFASCPLDASPTTLISD
jgi:hypothetical protein